MAPKITRVYLDLTWGMEVVDPGFDSIELIRSIDSTFRVKTSPLKGFSRPRMIETRKIGCGLSNRELGGQTEDTLWEVHRYVMDKLRSRQAIGQCKRGEASLMNLKIEISSHILSRCRFCANCCNVDRTRRQRGICRLGPEAWVDDYYVHIGEETPINPSLALTVFGCGLRCRFCHKAPLLDPGRGVEKLRPALWKRLDTKGARSLSFIGGNPDESTSSILLFLSAAPPKWRLPIVWNCHGYATSETLELLDGVVDVFLPDFKYGNNACGRKISGVKNYTAIVKKAITTMISQGATTIVRIVLLPGHLECCHFPVLEFLSTLSSDRLIVSILGQYRPDWRICAKDGELTRRPTHEEVEEVRGKASALGLQLVV